MFAVTDRKLAIEQGTSGVVEYFTADLLSFSDYYPYGMVMPGRNGSVADYRYGFQGQEMDDEVKGKGNSVNYKYRMHDPRIGRFYAVDPLSAKYPYYSPYSFSGNRVIDSKELEGLEPTYYMNTSTGDIEPYDDYYGSEFTQQETNCVWGEECENVNVTYSFIQYQDVSEKLESEQDVIMQGGAQESPGNGESLVEWSDKLFDKLEEVGGSPWVDGSDYFSQKADDLKKGTNGRYYDGWGGNGSVKTSDVFDKKFLKSAGDNLPIISTMIDATEVADGFRKDGYTIGRNTIKEAAMWAGGAAMCSWLGPLGIIIGGTIGAIIGGWLGENAAEEIVESAADGLSTTVTP